MPYDIIGEKYGCSGSNIRKQAKKLGIVLPKRREINENETFGKGVYRRPEAERGLKDYQDFCPVCGRPKCKTAELCRDCADKIKQTTPDLELGYYIGYEQKEKYLTSKCVQIRKDARRFMDTQSNQEKVCAYCHNHEFDDILEVHHIQPITSFDPHTKIKDINCDSNLV